MKIVDSIIGFAAGAVFAAVCASLLPAGHRCTQVDWPIWIISFIKGLLTKPPSISRSSSRMKRSRVIIICSFLSKKKRKPSCLFIYPSINPSIYLFIHPSLFLFIYNEIIIYLCHCILLMLSMYIGTMFHIWHEIVWNIFQSLTYFS